MRFPSHQSITRPKSRLFPKKNPPRNVGRHLVLGTVFVITLLCAYQLSLSGGFFRVQQIAVSGGNRYTQGEVIAALGLSPRQSNVHTISGAEIEKHLKRKLSYIKQASISKSVVKRSLTIQITEREPVALVKYPASTHLRFVLVDLEGYVLEYIKSPQAANAIVTIIGDGPLPPELGEQVDSAGVQLALKVLRFALSLAPEIVSTLHTINANQPDKMTLQFGNLPVVWLSSDLIETGIHHIDLFMKHQTTLVKKGHKISKPLDGYLDARFEEAVYWGGK